MPDEPEERQESQATEAQEETAGPETTVEREGPCDCVIRIQADPDWLEKEYREELESVQQEVRLPGFRRGKAPVGLVERRMGRTLRNDLIAGIIDEAYEDAVAEHDLRVVGQSEAPDVEEIDWEPGRPLDVRFRCEVLPEIELEDEDYTGLEIEAPELEPDEGMLEQEKQRFAQQFATWEEVTGPGIDWDDYVEAEATIEEADWSGEVEFYPRAERVGPFEAEGIKGATADAQAGEEVELEVQVTDEAVEEWPELGSLVDRRTPMRLHIRSVTRQNVPEVDDELAEKIGLESAEEIDDMLRDRIADAVEERRESMVRQLLIDELLQNVDFELPSSLVERAAQQAQRRELVRMLRSGVPREEAEERAEQQSDEAREGVVRRLKATYLLRRIAERERILVTESEVQSQIRAFASRQGWNEERAEQYLEEQDMLRSLRDDIRENKTLEFLAENARVEEIPREEFEQRQASPQADERQETGPAGEEEATERGQEQ